MKFIFLFIGVIAFSNDIVSQGEFINNNTAIVSKSTITTKPNTFLSNVVFSKPDSKKKTSSIPEPNTMQFMNNNDFQNPGDEYKDKLNKNEDFLKNFRKNQFLGEFKTNSSHVRISYRDYDAVDGDLVSILVNEKVMYARIFLEGDFQGIELPLEKGFNKIDFLALTEGDRSPNTAEFRIYDDKGFLISSNKWGLLTGYKATIIIVKD